MGDDGQDRINSAALMAARTTSRPAILNRVRRATAAFRPEPVVRNYRRAGAEPRPDDAGLLDQFVDRLLDYKAEVSRCPSGEVSGAVAGYLSQEQAQRVVIPHGFPPPWRPVAEPPAQPAVELLADDGPLSAAALDRIDGVVTTCAVAVAETGTIVLDGGPGQGRRALTLLPDLHVVVVGVDQLVARVPDALDRLDPRRPLTWISGPSATSDIELNRVEGVHGPRRLRVVVAEG